MAGIVCAIRGGPSSQPTITKSIQLAKDTGETIYFLYVVNLDFLSRSSSSKTNHISREMSEMGEFILLSTQEQASAQEVVSQGVIRKGQVMDEIIAYCEELDPAYVVLGRPQEEQEDNLLTSERLGTITERIKEVCQASLVFPNE